VRDESSSEATAGAFPATAWSKLFAVRNATSTERRDEFNFLIGRYWKPVYYHVRRCGCAHEEAEHRVQGFFRFASSRISSPRRIQSGPFRNLLLSSLNNYFANQHPWEHAQKRRSEKGFVDIHNLGSDGGWRIVTSSLSHDRSDRKNRKRSRSSAGRSSQTSNFCLEPLVSHVGFKGLYVKPFHS
jgi:hypothetical protein